MLHCYFAFSVLFYIINANLQHKWFIQGNKYYIRTSNCTHKCTLYTNVAGVKLNNSGLCNFTYFFFSVLEYGMETSSILHIVDTKESVHIWIYYLSMSQCLQAAE